MKCFFLYCFFFLLQTSRSRFWGKMYLSLHGTAAFYHCYIQVPCFLFYPLNSNLEIPLQCDSSVVTLEEQREYTIMAKTHTYPFTCMKCREMRHCMTLALYLKSSIQDRTNTVGQKERSLAAGISISQYFSKLSWLGTQPARQGPWNLSRKKSQLTLWKGFPHLCCRIDSLLRSLEKNIDFFFFFCNSKLMLVAHSQFLSWTLWGILNMCHQSQHGVQIP